jgi:serine/threonine protein kinase HipA of HipAB toxin-antitoxin module
MGRRQGFRWWQARRLGLTHLGAREYDLATGRFLSDDPVMNTANPQQVNGLAVIADDIDVLDDSPHDRTHHTIYPTSQ